MLHLLLFLLQRPLQRPLLCQLLFAEALPARLWQYVDVQAVTRGKGFAGVMKRWGFGGQPASHGASLSHRSPGSMAGAAGSMYATRVWKGKKMPGRMGGERRTAAGLLVWKVLPKYNLLYLRGSVPGAKGCEVRLRDSTLPKGFARLAEAPPPFPTFLPGDDGDEDEAELLISGPANN